MPTQSQLFREVMIHMWDNGTPDPSWEDACMIAQVMGARPTADTTGPDEDDTVDWLFPDGSVAAIARNGSGVTNP